MSAIFVIIDPSGVRALPLARVKRAQTRKRGPVGGSIIFGIIFAKISPSFKFNLRLS